MNSGLTTLFVLSMAVDPVTPSTVYAGTAGGGVFVSTNNGQSWVALTQGLNNGTVTSLVVDPLNHNVVYAGTEGGGVYMNVRQ